MLVAINPLETTYLNPGTVSAESSLCATIHWDYTWVFWFVSIHIRNACWVLYLACHCYYNNCKLWARSVWYCRSNRDTWIAVLQESLYSHFLSISQACLRAVIRTFVHWATLPLQWPATSAAHLSNTHDAAKMTGPNSTIIISTCGNIFCTKFCAQWVLERADLLTHCWPQKRRLGDGPWQWHYYSNTHVCVHWATFCRKDKSQPCQMNKRCKLLQ